MKCAFASDVHFELPYSNLTALSFPEDVDVIVLAGDINVGKKTSDRIFGLARRYPRAHIVWVAGNHEFYHRNIDYQIERYKKTHERIHFLENRSVEINGITFIGCTLWTDFSIFGDAEKNAELAADSINDFVYISTEDDRQFTPADVARRFKESREFLESKLAVCDPAKTVVVTHFAPGIETRNMKYKPEGVTAYFQANVDDLIDKYQPSLWIYGHNHYSNDFYRGKTRLVSNQLGYPGEAGYIPEYDPEKAILLGSSK